MGIGVVLLFWCIAGLIGASLAAVLLGALTRSLPAPDESTRRARVVAARWLPFALLLYGGIFFLGYAAWCEGLRGVDVGIGDLSRVPLGAQFSLVMIDGRAGSIFRDVDSRRIVEGIEHIGQSGSVLFGIRGRERAFVFDTATGRLESLANRDELVRTMQRRGIDADLLPVDGFYLRRRWGWPDAAAVALGSVPAILFLVRMWRKTLRGHRSRPTGRP